MIELREWIRTVSLPNKPWLVLGKGPSFACRKDYDLGRYNLISLNHVVREQKVDVAHIIDLDVVKDCGVALLHNCRWLLMPRRPHVRFRPSQAFLLEDFVQADRVLQQLDREGRLVWYNLSSGEPVGDSPTIGVKWFSSEAALNILGLMGVKTVRSIGLDGGRGYSSSFRDLEKKTHLAAGHSSYDGQFLEMMQIVQNNGMDYAALVEPLRIFVGADELSMMGTRLLEYSIRKYASRPVQVAPMLDMPVPIPKDPRNRPRTGFSFARFLIPKLCNYRGRALYLDADMQVFADIAALWDIPFDKHKVLCTNQPMPPEIWKGHGGFQAGRQMSVMMLDCSRLDWDINAIVGGLDEGRYTYENLLFDLCLVSPDEIADSIPPEWNCLEHYEPGRTKLLHYTAATIQPWKNDENPLREIWMECFREAVGVGAIAPSDVLRHVQIGYAKPALAEALSLASDRSATKATAPGDVFDTSLLGRMQAAEVSLRQATEKQDVAARELTAVLEQTRQQLQQAHAQNRRLDQNLMALHRSWSWKIGRALTGPLRLLPRALHAKNTKKAG